MSKSSGRSLQRPNIRCIDCRKPQTKFFPTFPIFLFPIPKMSQTSNLFLLEFFSKRIPKKVLVRPKFREGFHCEILLRVAFRACEKFRRHIRYTVPAGEPTQRAGESFLR